MLKFRKTTTRFLQPKFNHTNPCSSEDFMQMHKLECALLKRATKIQSHPVWDFTSQIEHRPVEILLPNFMIKSMEIKTKLLQRNLRFVYKVDSSYEQAMTALNNACVDAEFCMEAYDRQMLMIKE